MPSPDILTMADLAERWQITPAELQRRMARLSLPAVNVGTDRKPEYRFRLAALEDWEARNEATIGQPAPAEGQPIPAARPQAVAVDYFRGRKARPAT